MSILPSRKLVLINFKLIKILIRQYSNMQFTVQAPGSDDGVKNLRKIGRLFVDYMDHECLANRTRYVNSQLWWCLSLYVYL